MLIYHYSPQTGAIIGVGEADESPLEAGVFLIPAFATEVAPPPFSDNEIAVWNGLDWDIQQVIPVEPPVDPEPDPEEPVIEADWNAFNAALLANVRLNQVCGAALQAGAIVAVTGLPAALSQVATNGVAAFGLVFNAVCQLGGATQSDRDTWAAIAESASLPAEFVVAVRG